MEKQEFLDRLRMSISGKVDAQTASDTMDYYEEYINTQVRKGRSMEDVMEELGDPRLIARTIVETSGRGGKAERTNGDDRQGERYGIRRALADVPGWVWLLVVLSVVLGLIIFVFRMLIRLAPLIGGFILITYVVNWFRHKK